MDDVRAGRLIATVRVHLALRQADLGELAAVSQKVVSLLERGRFEDVSVRNQRRVCSALGIESELVLRWRGGLGDRLIDRVHATVVEQVTSALVGDGWEVLPEFTFNAFGERGSVDILAWHPLRRALLIVEVKSRIQDVQAMLMAMSRKVRLVPGIVANERGWERRALGIIVAMPDSHVNRSVVAAHPATFDASFPARTAACRGWLKAPVGDLSGLLFLPRIPVRTAIEAAPGRVRRRHAQP
jgi:transcriptional regulator with XRE-family HTH domain